MNRVFLVLLIMDLMAFAYYVVVTVYGLTFSSPDVIIYQRVNLSHIFSTLFLLWFVFSYKKVRKLYVIYFIIVLIVDLLDGMYVFLHLPQTVPTLHLLEVINAGLNIFMSGLITIVYIAVSNGDSEVFPGSMAHESNIKSRLIKNRLI